MSRRSLLLVALLPLLAPARSALADDAKFYTSFMCQEDGPGESGTFDRNEARITRIGSGGSGRLVCPVIKDKIDCCGAAVEAKVYVTDWHPTGDVRCALSRRNTNGNAYTWTTRSTNGMSSATQILTIPLAKLYHAGALSLECTMPINTREYYTHFHNYSVSEEW